MKRCAKFLLVAFCGYALTCQAQPLLSASTEIAIPAERMPSIALAHAVIAAADHDDVESIDVCMAEKNIPKHAYQRVLRAVALPGVAPGERLFFVRPALKPYCTTFYGAHLFRYWLVAQQAGTPARFVIQHAGAGDAFEVLSSTTNGHRDIAETNCTANSCFIAIQKFTSNRYMPFQCSETISDDKGKTSKKTVECAH